jgi:magnesium chelatase family protein
MYAQIRGSILQGVEAFPVTVEVNVGRGLGYTITGQPDESVRESLGRIEVAIKSLGFRMPREKLSVNLSPAHIRKTGAGFDLPIAIGILLASDQLSDLGKLRDYMLVGELGLDGSILPVGGALCMANLIVKEAIKGIVLPMANAVEASLLAGIEVYGVSKLKEVLDFILTDMHQPMSRSDCLAGGVHDGTLPDFRQVRGQTAV